MNTKASSSNNDRLRALVKASGLTQADALAKFNRGLGPGAYSLSAWKGFLADSETSRFRPFRDELLAHAEKVLAPIAPRKRRSGR